MDTQTMDTFSHVPPGFRFHPTDEELVDYYLRKKIASKRIDLDVIKDVDLYKIEPWDLQEMCKVGAEDENEWYFFSHKDKKYPTGTRTNRATKAGFWKATGRDKAIYSKHSLVGMRKTLVFYKGRAPNGHKSDWIMHEYRLETNENGTPQEEGWVVCRVFKKRMPTVRKMGDYDSPCWYEPDQLSFMSDLDSPNHGSHPYTSSLRHHYKCKQELELHYNLPPESFLQLPQLESPKLPYGFERNHGCILQPTTTAHEEQLNYHNHNHNLNLFFEQGGDQMTDWRTMEKYVASQLSNDQDSSKQSNPQSFQVLEQVNILALKSKGPENSDEFATTSASSCQAGLWK